MKFTNVKLLFLLITLLLILSSCNGNGNITPIDTSDTDTGETDAVDTSNPDTDILETLEPPISPTVHELSEKSVVPLKATEITNHQLSFVEKRTNGDILIENSIRYNAAYVGNHYYYTDNAADPATMYLYDMSSHQIVGSFSYPFDMYFEVYYEMSGHFFMAPCHRTTEGLNMLLIDYDIESNTASTILDVPVKAVRIDIEPLNENEVLFFLYRNINNLSADTIYKYNIISKEISFFYESYEDDWNNSQLTSKNVKQIETFDGKAYLLKEQIINNINNHTLEIYDSNGSLFTSYELPMLNISGSSQNRAEKIYRFGNYFYFEFDTSSPTMLPKNKLLYLNDNEFINVDISMHSPVQAILDELLFNRYIIIASESNNYNIIIIDTKEHVITPVKLEVEEYYQVETFQSLCNDSGNILFTALSDDGNTRKLYEVDISHLISKE